MSDLKELVVEAKLHLEQQGWDKDWCEIDGASGDILERFIAIFDKYSLNMTEYFNGYAQAQEDGVNQPLSEGDLKIGIEMQKRRIKELTDREAKLAGATKRLLAAYKNENEIGSSELSATRVYKEALYECEYAEDYARATLKSLGIEGEG